MADDAIKTMVAQIKKLQKKIEELQARNLETDDLRDKVTELEAKLNQSPDFGEWG